MDFRSDTVTDLRGTHIGGVLGTVLWAIFAKNFPRRKGQ